MTDKLKVVLSHPGVGPFVQQSCKAFYENNMLESFYTTLISRNDNLIQKKLCNIFNIFNYDLETQLGRRKIVEIPITKVKSYPYLELIRIAMSKIDNDKRLTDLFFDWSVKKFDNYVANNALDSIDAIHGYEYCCLETFKKADKKNIYKIYEVPSAEHDYVESIRRIEFEKYPEFETSYYKYTKRLQHDRTLRRRKEWHLSDLVIANSEFTKKSYFNAGLDVEKVKVISLGCPPVINNFRKMNRNNNNKMTFIYAGTFSVMKGAHYLIEAWTKLRTKSAILNVYGGIDLPKSFLKNLPSSVNFIKTIPRSLLFKCFQDSDVLIFPTLCDGFGMVVSEALSNGLPVITTNRAGSSDFIKHKYNGLIIEAGDVDSLQESLEWCIENKIELNDMRKNALESAKKWQWDDYRRTLVAKILESY